MPYFTQLCSPPPPPHTGTATATHTGGVHHTPLSSQHTGTEVEAEELSRGQEMDAESARGEDKGGMMVVRERGGSEAVATQR